MSEGSWPVSGKVLIIDDDYKDVEQAVFELITKGIPVLFWDGKNDPPKNINNVRIILIDLVLADQERGPGFYLPAIQCLNKIPGPYVVIIVSVGFQDKDPDELLREYQSNFGDDPPGYIYEKGLTKDQLSEADQLARTIKSSLKEKSIMNLVLLWESILDLSKDSVLRSLIANKLEKTVVGLIETIYKDEGEGGAPRGFIQSLMRLQSRFMTSSKELEGLRGSLDGIRKMSQAPSDESIDNLLHWFLMYYDPLKNEDVRTGDIYEIKGEQGYSYSIVLTPVCDFAQGKSSMILTCDGCELDEKLFAGEGYPLLTEDPEIAGKEGDEAKKDAITKKYLKGKGTISDRFYLLWNFRKIWDRSEYTGVCFDFKNVHAHRYSEFKEKALKRVCRLDSPFVDLMLQRFGFYSSRMGQPDINKRHRYPVEAETPPKA